MDRGYYKVGEQKFFNKVEALLEGTKRHIHPTWHFNEDVFNNIDWSKPISKSLESLYKMRAMQLRETYDHIIVLFSGGADSTTVLDSFIKNNIHIDEIYIYWPMAAANNKKIHNSNTNNKNGNNILSEWDYSIKPKLEYIKKYHSKIKITVADYTANLFTEFTDELFDLTGHNLLAGYYMRQNILKTAALNLSQSKKIALVAGIDKPRIHVDHQAIYGYFLDIPCYSQRPNSIDDNRVVELFYWTPDVPELTIKSYQTISTYIKNFPAHGKYFKNDYENFIKHNEIQRAITNSLLYKDWNNKTFQVGKSTSDIYPEHDQWIHQNFHKELFVNSWKSKLKFYMESIDDKYFKFNSDNKKIGFVGFTSPMYKILNL